SSFLRPHTYEGDHLLPVGVHVKKLFLASSCPVLKVFIHIKIYGSDWNRYLSKHNFTQIGWKILANP
ncbi:MAG TPA: hypothetical protein VFN98_07600, partial [Nitrososphaeraceae archaeon]|nr:hypothetical protein [Nitrososphaeraceae archaeon]